MNGTSSKPLPRLSSNSIPEIDENEHPLSDSSSSSADSASSVNTLRPRTTETGAAEPRWSDYFDAELSFQSEKDGQIAKFHVYLTTPSDVKKGPLFICHHGAGASGLSFALFARYIRTKLPDAGVLSLEARGHGSVVTQSGSDEEVVDFSLETLASDALRMIHFTQEALSWAALPPTVLVGHSLGGAIVTQLAMTNALGPSLVGFCVLDVVEGSALEALTHMKTYLTSRPRTFNTVDEAITWHTRTRTIRSHESALISVPSLLVQTAGGEFTWRTDLSTTTPWWECWFKGMSSNFLKGRGAKLLMLAGTDRLDRDLMIAQMQGKFQLVVLPEAGHFIQEDLPERTAEVLKGFWERNDRSGMVLPPKVSDLIAQGKKV